ncbi:MAG TPA: alpha/beta fold hydrolase [Blastocatellia bacterium]|nr:alpha/beta fold hydrolase [Blastocatellia bacterium]
MITRTKNAQAEHLRTLTVTFLLLASYAIPMRADLSAQSKTPDSTDPSSRFVSLDGARVHYKSFGRGSEALVFIHGWACDLDFWRQQWPAFQGKTRVIAIDLPGHGQSDKPQIAYTQDLFARAVDAAMRDAEVDRAVLVGHSMGTPVIRQFYRKYPAKVLALVIVDGALRPYGDKAMMERFIAPLRGANYKEAAAGFIDGMLGATTPAATREEVKRSMLATPQHVAVSAMDGMNDPAIWTNDRIEVPVLAVLASSPFWPADTEQFYRSIAPKLEYVVWEGVSHFLMMEKPVEFNDALRTFLMKNGFLKGRNERVEESRIIDFGAGLAGPPTRRVQPHYPAKAKKALITGAVVVRIVVDEEVIELLVDENLPRSLVAEIRRAGFEARDVRDVGLRGSPDDEIFKAAIASDSMIITRDRGFASEKRWPAAFTAGVIHVALPGQFSVGSINSRLVGLLTRRTPDSLAGSITTVESRRALTRVVRKRR